MIIYTRFFIFIIKLHEQDIVLEKFNEAKSKQQYILQTFLNAIKGKKNVFKQKYYVIYKYEKNQDKPIVIIDARAWKLKDI